MFYKKRYGLFSWRSKRFRGRITRIMITIFIVIGSWIILIPLLWMVSTSLKTDHSVADFPPEFIPTEPQLIRINGQDLFLYDVLVDGQERVLAAVKLDPVNSEFLDPNDLSQKYYAPASAAQKHKIVRFHWENYSTVWDFPSAPFSRYVINTFIYATIVAIGEVLSCSFVAYGFARLHAPGKNYLFILVLSTLMIPSEVLIVPSYVLFARQIPDLLSSIMNVRVVLTDTWWPIILPKFFGEAFLIFLVRQFYLGIPRDYDDAAHIDGCGYFGTWWRIILPMSRPVLVTVAILSFQYHWAQDYMAPLIYLNSNERMPLTVGLANFQASYGGTPWNLMMAGAVIAVVPLILIFFILNRYFIQGVVVSGITE